MRKLFWKILLFIIPVYGFWFVYIEYAPLYYNEANNTRWYYIKQQLENPDAAADASLLFLGESRVNAGIDFTRFNNVRSFASGGASSIEMYYVLEKYLKHHPPPDTVFLSVSPRFLCEIFAFYPYAIRNDFFSGEDISEIRKIAAKLKADSVPDDFLSLSYLLRKIHYPQYYQSDVRKNYGFAAYKKNKAMIADMNRRKGGRHHPGLKDSCGQLNYETRYTDFQPAPVLDYYLKKTAELCRSKNIFLVFEAMPVNRASYQKLNSEFLSKYQKYMQDFAQAFPEHQISDSLYAYPNRFFGDPSHLNEKGKAKFTNSLKERLLTPNS